MKRVMPGALVRWRGKILTVSGKHHKNYCFVETNICKEAPASECTISSSVTHGRGYVYCLQYHIVWCTKYRNKVLTGSTDTDLKQILYDLADEQDIKILAMETMPDHVHMLIEATPQCRLSDAIKIFKGTSAWHLFKKHPELKKVSGADICGIRHTLS